MHRHLRRTLRALALTAALPLAAAPLPEWPLWPGRAPGETAELEPERDTTKPTDNLVAGKRLIRLGHVSSPTLALHPAPADRNSGCTVLVCPGGAYNILALDLEGSEVCAWLNSLGVNAALLKYRVPRRAGREKHAPALQDAQRAISLLRHRAGEFQLDPKRIGVIGFSAGGHLAAALSTTAARTYPVVDEADAVEVRPQFTVLIYPGYLTVKEQDDRLSPELTVNSNTPPTFIAISQDDPVRVENALGYAQALQRARVPLELHVYPTGGHGYGLRRTSETVTSWPDRLADWFQARRWLER